MTIEEILAGESKNVEFKENLSEKSIKYMKSVVAFANGTGGKIIFGIADKTREVVGFDKEDVFKKMDAIANAVSDSCEPAIIPDITLQTVDGKTVIVAEISEGRQRPYYIKALGREGGVYVRVAGTTRLADEYMIKELPMGQTLERMKEGYSKIRNEALAHAFAYMNLIEHWGSGIPRIIDKVKAAGLREPEFIGGEVDLRINIYREQGDTNNAKINAKSVGNGTNSIGNGTNGVKIPQSKEQTQEKKLLQVIEENPSATQAYYAEQMGVSKRTISRMFVSLQEKGTLVRNGTKRKSNWVIIKQEE